MYFIGDSGGSITVSAADDGTECLVGFTTKELAELHVDQVEHHGITCSLVAIEDVQSLLDLLRAVEDDVKYIAWNNTANQSISVLLPVPDVIELL